MKKDSKNPLSDLISQVQAIEKDAPASIDKRRHQADAKQIEAIGRLISTITNLDKQSRNLEETNIKLQKATMFLGLVGLLFTAHSVFSDLKLSLITTFAVAIPVYLWIQSKS